MGSDGAWRRATRVALFLIAGLTASAAPRSPFSTPAAAAPSTASRAMQASDPDTTDVGDEDDGDDGEAPPIPVFEDEQPAPPPPSTNVPAMRDSSAILRVSPPDSTAPAETLRYVPPSERIMGVGPRQERPGDEPAPIVKKPKGGLFGLPPIFIILGLTVVHIMVVRTVTE
jgi:hypothetical protein